LKRGGGRVENMYQKLYITTECMWKLDCPNLYCQRLYDQKVKEKSIYKLSWNRQLLWNLHV
jgi:hypothetical protein